MLSEEYYMCLQRSHGGVQIYELKLNPCSSISGHSFHGLQTKRKYQLGSYNGLMIVCIVFEIGIKRGNGSLEKCELSICLTVFKMLWKTPSFRNSDL